MVEEKDVIWSPDATHLGKREEGGKLMSQVLVDVQDGSVLAASLVRRRGPRTRWGSSRRRAGLRGGLPLVLSIDNGYATRALTLRGEGGRDPYQNLPQTPRTTAGSSGRSGA
ncbi:MAG: hypothetical protein R3C29_17785 [Dehalococcoidia bacterium]